MKVSLDAFQFQKVTPMRVSDFILEQLEEAIILKEILPEEQLPPERELANIFKASRLSIREAIAELEKKELIERRLGNKGGTFVLPVTSKAHQRTIEEIKNDWNALEELLEFRSFIEPEAARLSASRISEQNIAYLKMLVNKSMEADCTREMFRSLDVKFHLLIGTESRNTHIKTAVRKIRTKLNPVLDLIPFSKEVTNNTYKQHLELIQAFEERDEIKARDIMQAHISKTLSEVHTRVFESNK
ncbi:FadR/GntR family transcriptional regulator [Niallia sp. 01092]|uniref:FadR/GntR family transcriptional regulator n=1 Tax=unclassified Niallia TaxID=2837522 RepID=UPI003FD2FDA2